MRYSSLHVYVLKFAGKKKTILNLLLEVTAREKVSTNSK